MGKQINPFFIWNLRGNGTRRKRPPFSPNLVSANDYFRSQPDLTQPRPEDFLPSAPRETTPFQKWPSAGMGQSVTVAYLLMVLMSITNWGFHLLWNPAQQFKTNLWVSKTSIYSDGEYWRLFTALFVHADLLHLAHNSMTFLFFGWILRGYFGWLAFPALSLAIGALSNLVTIHMYNDDTHLLGASGMIYGMVALWLTLYITFDRTSPMTHRVMRSLGFSLMILFPQSYEPRVSYLAHASGFMLGIAFAVLSIPVIRHTAPVLKSNHLDLSNAKK